MKTTDNEISPANKTRYTLNGSAEVENRIGYDQFRIAAGVKHILREHLYAVVLMGGYGRGEGGYCQRHGQSHPYNDYDYFIIVRGLDSGAMNQFSTPLHTLAQKMEEEIGVEIDFAILRLESLAQAEFSLMNTEMLWGHRVICGKTHALDSMPRMSFAELPQGEFTRLMLNRGTLLLMNELTLYSRGPIDAGSREKFIKYLFKAILACGDAVLAAEGYYHPSYPEKLKRLKNINFGGLRSLKKNYLLAYKIKFHADYSAFLEVNIGSWQNEVVNIWLNCLSLFESSRLNQKSFDWEHYCKPEVYKGQDCRPLRNLAITCRDYGFFELFSHPILACHYPRERLIAALPILLQGNKTSRFPSTTQAAKALAVTPKMSWRQLSKSYLQQWVRYA